MSPPDDDQIPDRESLLNLIRDLTNDEPCDYDHHGGCQTHGYLNLEPAERCPHDDARQILTARERREQKIRAASDQAWEDPL